MNIRRFISLALAGMIFMMSLSGCAADVKNKKDDENTLTINFGIRNVELFIAGLEKQFPDIDFEIKPAYCANSSGYLRKTLITGNSSDIFYYTQKPDGAEAAEYLLDLSGYDFISNFDRAVINTYLEDGHIYCIPGPMALRGIAYNKTLFEEHGWEKPENNRELAELCRRICVETEDITPISMSLGGLAYPFTLVTTFSQAGSFGTPAGEEWEKRFKAGEASVAEGWSDGLEITAELIDAGAFGSAADYVGVWDGDAGNMEFAKGKSAMFIMWAGQAALLQMIESNPDYEYAFMPFYGKEEGEVTIGASSNTVWGISKRLGEPGNEKKLKNALRVMEWFSTAEAQELMKSYITNENGELVPTAAEMTPLITAEEDRESSPYFRELWEQADKGNKMPMIYSGYESVIVNGGTIIQDAIISGSSEGMAEKFIASVDSDYKDYLAGGEASVIFTVTQDFSEEETAQLLANGINEAGLGDLTLITHTGRAGVGIENKTGAGVRYLAGKYTSHEYNIILGSLKDLKVLSLTGAQVRQLLSGGKRVYSTSDETKYADFPYYWSGIDVTLSKDGSVKSAKLNGSELDDGAVYKVVFISGDYTEETEQAGDPADTEISISDYWLGYVSEHRELSPPEVLRKR